MAFCGAMTLTSALLRIASLISSLLKDAGRLALLGPWSTIALKAENLFLRKQLALYVERKVKPRRADEASRQGGSLKLLSPCRRVWAVLRVIRLPDIIPTFEDETKALASFRPQGYSARP